MRLSITAKLCVGLVLVLVLSLVTLYFKSSDILKDDKTAFFKEQSVMVSGSLAQTTSEKIKRLNLELLTAGSGPFQLKGLLKRDPKGPWIIQWNSPNIDQIASDFSNNIQKLVTLDRIPDRESVLLKLSGNGQTFALLTKASRADGADNQDKIYVGILPASGLFDLTTAYKGTTTTAFVVDKNGNVFSHPLANVVGTIISHNPIVRELSTSAASSDSGEFADQKDQLVIGSFDKVGGTNLYAVSGIPWSRAKASLSTLRWSFIFLGLGIILVASVFAFAAAKILRNPLIKLRRAVEDIGSNRPIQVEWQNDDEIGDLSESLYQLEKKLREKEIENQYSTMHKINQEKASSFNQFSQGLVNELRNPLIGMLGHAQLAKEKLREPEHLFRHLDAIERECRKTKEVIEDIGRFTGADKLDLVPTSCFETITAAIEQAERKFYSDNISVAKNLNSVPNVLGNHQLLKKAVFNILHVSSQLLNETEKQEISVRLDNGTDGVQIGVLFKPVPLTDAELEKIFDPFFISQGHINLGLDLSLAKGIIHAHNGELSISRLGPVGVEFMIRFPKSEVIPTQSLASSAVSAPAPVGVPPNEAISDKIVFSLPDIAVAETVPTAAPSKEITYQSEKDENGVINKKFLARIPLESLKVKVKQPRLRL